MNTLEENKTDGRIAYAVGITLVATLGGLLFGYDTAVISGTTSFLTAYYGLSAAMLGWAASCALIGCVVGAVFAGLFSNLIGRKKVLVVSAILFFISAVGTGFPPSFSAFIIFRIIGGIAVGAASMTSPMYIAEISPARHRGRLVSLNQFAIVFGMLLVYFVNYFIVAYGGSIDQAAGVASEALESWNVQYGWRWMFASEALPALALFVLLFFVPESPRWLAARGRDEEARGVLARVDGRQFAEKEMAGIRESQVHGQTSLGTMLQTPVIALLMVYGLALAFFQQATGINVFLYFAPDLFKSMAGEKIDAAMLMTIVVGAANLIFTVVGILAVDKVGRKPLMVVGYLGMALCMAAIGISAMRGAQGNFLLVFMIGYIACFAFSVGPVTWVLLSEIFPTRVRGQLMAAATVCLWGSNFLVSQTFPMMDRNEALVDQFNHGFPFLVYGGVAVVAALFVAIFIPETKGRSLEEFESALYSDSAIS